MVPSQHGRLQVPANTCGLACRLVPVGAWRRSPATPHRLLRSCFAAPCRTRSGVGGSTWGRAMHARRRDMTAEQQELAERAHGIRPRSVALTGCRWQAATNSCPRHANAPTPRQSLAKRARLQPLPPLRALCRCCRDRCAWRPPCPKLDRCRFTDLLTSTAQSLASRIRQGTAPLNLIQKPVLH